MYNYQDVELCPIVLKHLKYVSLKLALINFNLFEPYIKHFFRHVEVLRLTTKHDPAYLDAKRWENLITSYMPNLCIFDLFHIGFLNRSTYHDLTDQFNSSFWVEKKWFFSHQHNSIGRANAGVFYSTQPYR
jgi:hypothetical protein